MLMRPDVGAVIRAADGEVLVEANGQSCVRAALRGLGELAIELELDPFVKVDHVRICGAETADVGRLGIAEAHRPVTPGEERSVFRAEVFLERAVHGEPIERQPFLLHIALVGEATLAVTTEMPCFERAIQTLEYG